MLSSWASGMSQVRARWQQFWKGSAGPAPTQQAGGEAGSTGHQAVVGEVVEEPRPCPSAPQVGRVNSAPDLPAGPRIGREQRPPWRQQGGSWAGASGRAPWPRGVLAPGGLEAATPRKSIEGALWSGTLGPSFAVLVPQAVTVPTCSCLQLVFSRQQVYSKRTRSRHQSQSCGVCRGFTRTCSVAATSPGRGAPGGSVQQL